MTDRILIKGERENIIKLAKALHKEGFYHPTEYDRTFTKNDLPGTIENLGYYNDLSSTFNAAYTREYKVFITPIDDDKIREILNGWKKRKPFDINGYNVSVSKNRLHIGCQTYTRQEFDFIHKLVRRHRVYIDFGETVLDEKLLDKINDLWT